MVVSTSEKILIFRDAVEKTDMVAVKMKGLPFRVRYEEIEEFYQDYEFIKQSIILGENEDGRKNGFGAILFKNAEEAAKAAEEKQKQYVGSRYVDLSVLSYGDYGNFNEVM